MNKKTLMVGILAMIFVLIPVGKFLSNGVYAENLSLRELNAQCEEKRAQGYDLTEADALRIKAQRAHDRNDYKAARGFLTQAFDALEKAEIPEAKAEGQGIKKTTTGANPIRKKLSNGVEAATKQLPVRHKTEQDPFEMAQEYKLASEEIEPPEIQVTGIMKTKNDTVAVVKLNVGNYVGTVILEEGQKVTMPNPRTSGGDKWISYFLVKEITEKGIIIELENKREAYLPVLAQD